MNFDIMKLTTNRTIGESGLTTNLIISYSEKAFAGNFRFPIRGCFGSAEGYSARVFSFGVKMDRNEKGQFLKGTNGNTFEGFGISYDAKGYACICINGKPVKLHVYIWERVNGKKPEGCDIHHIDHNKGNYNLSNLQLLTTFDHRKLHAGWKQINGEWVVKPCNRCNRILPLSSFYSRKGKTPSAKCKPCHVADCRARYFIPETRQRISNQQKEIYLLQKESR